LVAFVKIGQHAGDRMPQPARDSMAIDGRADCLRNDQPDARTGIGFGVISPAHMNDKIGLRRAHPVFHCRVEFP
jgi:hypothetical protein